MRHAVMASYDAEQNEIKLFATNEELHREARSLPCARERRSEGLWVLHATAAVAARVVQMFGNDRLESHPTFTNYVRDKIHASYVAHSFLKFSSWPEIPLTAQQPHGVWMHQRKAFWFAYYLDAAMLAVTMGGGKTKIAIDLLVNWKSRDILIISPLAAIEDAWLPHFDKHVIGDYDVAALDDSAGTVSQRKATAEALLSDTRSLDHRFVVINHESFWREPFRSWAANRKWDLIIDDESHREKAAGSLQSKFLYQLGMRATRRLALTGTPMPHSPLDVYGQFRFLDRGIFGINFQAMKEEHAVMGGYMGREILEFRNLDKLQSKFATVAIRIDDSEQGLPEAVDVPHSVTLEPKARAIYAKLDKEFTAEVERGVITAANPGVKLLRLQQLANGFATLEDANRKVKPTVQVSTAKLFGLRDVLQDIAEQEPVVVFVKFRPDIGAITELLASMKRSSSELSGKVNQLRDWKRGETSVLVAQIQAANEGIDLTRSAVGIFYSTGISLGVYLQCRKRLHRPPQSRMVRFIHLIAKGTRDVSVMRGLTKRRSVIEEVLSDVRAEQARR